MLDPPANEPREVRYEKSDARIGVILAFGAGLVLALLVIHLVVMGLFDAFKAGTRHDDAPLAAGPQLPRNLKKIPPPLLQKNEIAELERFARRRRTSSTATAGSMRRPAWCTFPYRRPCVCWRTRRPPRHMAFVRPACLRREAADDAPVPGYGRLDSRFGRRSRSVADARRRHRSAFARIGAAEPDVSQ